MKAPMLLLSIILLALFSGCQNDSPEPVADTPQQIKGNGSETSEAAVAAQPETEAAAEAALPLIDQETPKPPVKEDFQGAPQLTLFPRVGDYRPADDSERLPYWNTFINHLLKVTDVVEEQSSGNRSWVFRSIGSIDSLGYFSPLAVEPDTSYQVTFKLKAELPDGASAGIGIIEFDEFLWIGAQYTEEVYKAHFRDIQDGRRLFGKTDRMQSFTFSTGPETRMIHLVLFRDGTHDRSSVIFDDIEIKARH